MANPVCAQVCPSPYCISTIRIQLPFSVLIETRYGPADSFGNVIFRLPAPASTSSEVFSISLPAISQIVTFAVSLLLDVQRILIKELAGLGNIPKAAMGEATEEMAAGMGVMVLEIVCCLKLVVVMLSAEAVRLMPT